MSTERARGPGARTTRAAVRAHGRGQRVGQRPPRSRGPPARDRTGGRRELRRRFAHPAGELGSRPDAELPVHPRQARLDGRLADEQGGGDLPVALPGGDTATRPPARRRSGRSARGPGATLFQLGRDQVAAHGAAAIAPNRRRASSRAAAAACRRPSPAQRPARATSTPSPRRAGRRSRRTRRPPRPASTGACRVARDGTRPRLAPAARLRGPRASRASPTVRRARRAARRPARRAPRRPRPRWRRAAPAAPPGWRAPSVCSSGSTAAYSSPSDAAGSPVGEGEHAGDVMGHHQPRRLVVSVPHSRSSSTASLARSALPRWAFASPSG